MIPQVIPVSVISDVFGVDFLARKATTELVEGCLCLAKKRQSTSQVVAVTPKSRGRPTRLKRFLQERPVFRFVVQTEQSCRKVIPQRFVRKSTPGAP